MQKYNGSISQGWGTLFFGCHQQINAMCTPLVQPITMIVSSSNYPSQHEYSQAQETVMMVIWALCGRLRLCCTYSNANRQWFIVEWVSTFIPKQLISVQLSLLWEFAAAVKLEFLYNSMLSALVIFILLLTWQLSKLSSVIEELTTGLGKCLHSTIAFFCLVFFLSLFNQKCLLSKHARLQWHPTSQS